MHVQHQSAAYGVSGREFSLADTDINRRHFMGDHFYYGPHVHEGYFDWFFVAEGELHQVINGEYCVMSPGDLVWVRNGDWHEETGDHLRFFALYGTESWMESVMASLRASDVYQALKELPAAPACRVPQEARAALRRKWERCYNMHLANYLSELYVTDLVSEIMIEYFLPLVADSRQRNHFPDWLRQGLDYIEHHITEGVSPSQLAAVCHKSPGYVIRSFQRYLGMTPSHFINQQKLNHAARLLCTTEQPILEISLTVHFNSPSYFHRLFKERFYCSPSEYRERHRQALQSVPESCG